MIDGLLLAVHSYPGANATFARHWPYFQNSGADLIVGVDTIPGGCVWPHPMLSWKCGDGLYMNGPNLPERLVQTIEAMMYTSFSRFCICEYDTLFFRTIPKFSGVCCDRTGGRLFDAGAEYFAHNPWCFDYPSCVQLAHIGRLLLQNEPPGYGTANSSPDVFFALMCERAGIVPQHDLFRLFSRNSFDCPGDLERAREAYRSGVDCIHGVKKPEELAYLLES